MPIDTKHPAYSSKHSSWKRCSDAYEGAETVKMAGIDYLPKPSGLDSQEYRQYVARAQYVNFLARTVDSLAGAVMRIAPTTKLPSIIASLEEDATGQLTPLEEVSKQVLTRNILTGRAGVLVDKSPSPQVGDTPYLITYNAQQIVNWRTNSEGKLTMVVLMETYEEPDTKDSYKSLIMTQFRELVLQDGVYTIKIWRKKSKSAKFAIYEVLTPTLSTGTFDFIPFVFISPTGNVPWPSKSPVSDLCDVNIGHYMNSADLEHGSHLTALPTPYAVGVKQGSFDGGFPLGSTSALVQTSKDAKFGMLEFSGSGLDQLKQRMEEKQNQMAVLGARFLESQKPGVEAEGTVRIHRSGDVSVLSGLATATGNGIEQALKYAAIYEGVSPEEVEFQLNQDFIDFTLTPQQLAAYMKARQENRISQETFFTLLKKGEIIPQERTLEEEENFIEEDILKDAERNASVMSSMGLGMDVSDTEDEDDDGA